jgi:hypothetical protein
MTSDAKSEGNFGSRTSSIGRRRRLSLPSRRDAEVTTTPTWKMGWRYAAIGRRPAGPVRSRAVAQRANSVGSPAGSTNMSSKPCNGGLDQNPKARRSAFANGRTRRPLRRSHAARVVRASAAPWPSTAALTPKRSMDAGNQLAARVTDLDRTQRPTSRSPRAGRRG